MILHCQLSQIRGPKCARRFDFEVGLSTRANHSIKSLSYSHKTSISNYKNSSRQVAGGHSLGLQFKTKFLSFSSKRSMLLHEGLSWRPCPFLWIAISSDMPSTFILPGFCRLSERYADDKWKHHTKPTIKVLKHGYDGFFNQVIQRDCQQTYVCMAATNRNCLDKVIHCHSRRSQCLW